jgi:hypothetical protein
MTQCTINTAYGPKTPEEALHFICNAKMDTEVPVLLSMLRGLIRAQRAEAVIAANHVLRTLPNTMRQLKNVAGDHLRQCGLRAKFTG